MAEITVKIDVERVLGPEVMAAYRHAVACADAWVNCAKEFEDVGPRVGHEYYEAMQEALAKYEAALEAWYDAQPPPPPLPEFEE